MEIFTFKVLRIVLAIFIVPIISYFIIIYSFPALVATIPEVYQGTDQSIAEAIFALIQVLIGYYIIHKTIQSLGLFSK